MGKPELLIYSFVARGKVIIAEYTAYSGNFTAIAAQCLEKLPLNSGSSKFTYPGDGRNFNFLVEKGLVYFVLSDESYGKTLPFTFLARIKDEFQRKFASKAENAPAGSLSKDFGPKLKEEMKFCEENPQELDRITQVKAEVTAVKGVIMQNIEKLLERGEKLEVLVDRTDLLRSGAENFQRQGKSLQNKMWWENAKAKVMILLILIIVAIIIWLTACKGFVCH